MLNKLKERSKEPSTWLSLGAIITATGELLKDDNMPAIGEAVAEAAPQAASGNWQSFIALLFGGLIGAFMPERSN